MTEIPAPLRNPKKNISIGKPSSVVCKFFEGLCVWEQKKENNEVGQRKWSSLFGIRPGGKSSFPPVTSKSYWEKG